MTELERATQAYCQEHNDDCFEAIGDECPFIEKAFKAGANWQYEQFEKNRLAACDNMTKAEQYIKDFTRGYSNEFENGEFEYWLTPWQAEAACNLKKEETINKSIKWLKDNIHYDDFGGNMEWYVPFADDECMIQHFKIYMEE